MHSSATLDDSSANAEKYWSFQTDTVQFDSAFRLSYEERTLSTHTPLQHLDFTWAQTPTTLNPYVGTIVTKLDPGQTYEADKQTVQTLDQYGNVLQTQMYNFGAGAVGSLARTYTNTYLNSSSYTSRYIVNRLQTSALTDGTNSTTLVSNSFDGTSISTITGLYEHDDANFPASFKYRGNVTNSTTASASVTNYYDMAGNVTSATRNGVTTGLSTSSATNFAATEQLTTNSLSSSASWSTFLGIKGETGPNGDNAHLTYDGNARPSQSTSKFGAITYYTYNDSASPPNVVAKTNSHWIQTVMDGLGRTIQSDQGYNSTTASTVDTTYIPVACSPFGTRGQTSEPYAPGGSDAWTVYNYDASGRTTSVAQPDGSTTSYIYQGNNVLVYDPAGKWKEFTMDSFGNLVTVWEPDPALGTVSTNYTYDILNHLTSVSMPRGANTQTRTFNYNVGATVTAFLQSATNPETGTITYTYNSNNLLANKTDAKGQNFTYQYDSYNRRTSITWTNAPGGAQVLRTFMYDTNTLDGTFSGSYTQGRLVAVQNAQFKAGTGTSPSSIQLTEMYAYTKAGFMSGKRLQVTEQYPTWLNSKNLDTLYTDDNEGKTVSVTYPTTDAAAGPVYTNSFDNMSRLTGLTDQNNSTDVSGVSYNAANQLLGITYFGATETRQYNGLQQLTSLVVTGNANISYTYNFPTGTNNGQISSQVVSGETITYQYDSLKRLASASSSAGWAENYGYDSFGNLTAMTPTAGSPPQLSQAVNPVNNQIVGQSYDANGNQLTTAAGALNYDSENHFVTAPGVQYAYDSHNKRVWTGVLTNGVLSSQSVFVYGSNGKLLGQYSIALKGKMTVTMMNLTVYFGKKRVGITNSSGVTTAFATDKLGSSGQFYPYGEGKNGNNPVDTWSFATYWTDSATSLNYANRRYYSNQFGRFMTPDPSSSSVGITNPQSWNRYTYTLGDPVNYNDPSGATTCDSSGCYDSVTVNGDTGVVSWSDIPPGGLPVSGGASVHLSMLSQYSIQTWQKYVSLQWQLYETAQATGCPNGETRMGNGSCDLQLDSTALQVIKLINQLNPGGFINTMGLAMASAVVGGDMTLAAADGAWLIEASNNTILLGRYSDGYVTLGGIVGADTFSVPAPVYEAWDEALQWSNNQAFLDAAIANDSTIMFASDPLSEPAGSGVAQEYNYLVQQGYKVVQDGNGGYIAVRWPTQ